MSFTRQGHSQNSRSNRITLLPTINAVCHPTGVVDSRSPTSVIRGGSLQVSFEALAHSPVSGDVAFEVGSDVSDLS